MHIEIDILWLDAEKKSQQDAGLNIDLEQCTTMIHTFFNIAFIRPSDTQGYTEIASDGELFISPIEYPVLRDRIIDNFNFKLN